ncbi:MAG: 2-succinyl-5-enolpyruvyl-6-hydroxy-3-cyclohexene-1-carboxylic-acid synthase [Balneolaceae bacterium]
MPDRDPHNLNFYWSTLFVRSLYEQGITRIIISPGSRSTPLTLAFIAHPGFTKIINIDERSAAFMALGMSKVDKVPTCLLCTSGSAVANYFPAIIEASQSNIPLLVLSADRPPHLRGIGASQTIDQLKIFGDYPVFFHEIGEPKESNNSILRLERAAIQAVHQAVSLKGVSHLNFAFSKPFEPSNEFLEIVKSDNEKQAKKKFSNSLIQNQTHILPSDFWVKITDSNQPLIIAGCDIDSDLGNSIQNLAKVLNAPILIEPGSNLSSSKYTVTGFDGFLRNQNISEELTPDLILRFGRDPVSKALQNYLNDNAGVRQIRFVVNGEITDESLTADEFIYVDEGFEITEVESNADKEWIRSWRRHQKSYYSQKERLMFPTSPLTDGYVFHTISSLIPSKSFTMLSNSFPIRDMALFGDYDGKEIYVNRGTAGIDGILSTAIGLSKVSKKTGVLFIGDIAFLHDSNALLKLHEIEDPLKIVVLNNGGGSIFKMLPINEHKNEFSDYFETPHNVSLAALCRAHKIDHTLISRPEQIIPTFESLIERPGAHIFECMTDAEDSMDLRRILWDYKPDAE